MTHPHPNGRSTAALPHAGLCGLVQLPCIGGPLNGELHESSGEHVLWCVANGGPANRPAIVLLHRSVLRLPVVVQSITESRDTLGCYRVDAVRRVLQWWPRAGGKASDQ